MEKKALFSAGVDRRNSVSFDTFGQVDETENRETHRHTRVQGLQLKARKFLEPPGPIVVDRDTCRWTPPPKRSSQQTF